MLWFLKNVNIAFKMYFYIYCCHINPFIGSIMDIYKSISYRFSVILTWTIVIFSICLVTIKAVFFYLFSRAWSNTSSARDTLIGFQFQHNVIVWDLTKIHILRSNRILWRSTSKCVQGYSHLLVYKWVTSVLKEYYQRHLLPQIFFKET